MNTVLLRRTVSLLIAGACIAFIAAVALGAIRLGINPKDASLALRIDASRTLLFLRTDDREFFRQMFDRLVLPIVPGTEPLSEKQLPKGDRYEVAVLRAGSGSAWVMYVHESNAARHQTVVSLNDPSLFLPISKAGLSLERSALIREYAGTRERAWMYAERTAFSEDSGVIGKSVAALLSKTKALLLVWRENGKGTVILAGAHPGLFQRAESTAGNTADVPLVRLSVGSADHALSTFGTLLYETDPALFEGLSGIIRAKLKSLTGRTDIGTFGTEMLPGPATLVITRAGAEIAVGITGNARSEREIGAWMQAFGTADQGTRVREIVFPKKENTRIDIVPETAAGVRELGDAGAWKLFALGGSGSTTPLYVGVSGHRYAATTEEGLLRSLASDGASEEPGTHRTDAFITGTADMGWLLHTAETSLQGAGAKQSAERLLGPSPSRLTFDARPVDLGWLINWSLTRTLPFSPSRSLVK